MFSSGLLSANPGTRRASVDRALEAIEREFIRGIFWLGLAALQFPVQSSDNRAAMMVGVAALGALGGLFVDRKHLWNRVRQILFNLLGNAIKLTNIGQMKVTVGVDDRSD